MLSYSFECPNCKTQWTIDDWSGEVLCPACDTMWDTKYDTFDCWPPNDVTIDKRSEHQPKFDVTIRGVRVPGCLGIKIEQTSYKAHSAIEYSMVLNVFYVPDDGGAIFTGPADIEIRLRAKPDLPPIRLRADVSWEGGSSLRCSMDGAGYEFARQQIEAMWEKTNAK